MKIDLFDTPDPDIFRDKKKYLVRFNFFLGCAGLAVGLGVYAIMAKGHQVAHLDNWALGILVFSAMGVTRYGNYLQQYKALFPPQLDKLNGLREQYSVVNTYCQGVENLQRRYIRAEYEACVEYAECQEHEREQAADTPAYGPIEPADAVEPNSRSQD